LGVKYVKLIHYWAITSLHYEIIFFERNGILWYQQLVIWTTY